MLIVTGMSGAGKTIAVNTLQDLGYYCVDNLPVNLLEIFVREFALQHTQPVAVAIDSRNAQKMNYLAEKLQQIKQLIPLQILFLDADDRTLGERFSESRRPHPLHSNNKTDAQLSQAIKQERNLMSEINDLADINIDSSSYTAGDLREKLMSLFDTKSPQLMLTIQSFGFKHGTPVNADFIYDVRFLPNPHWDSTIRHYSGTQKPVIDWLDAQTLPHQFIQDTADYLITWLPHFLKSNNRAYLTICIGCTGGQHRSVYVSERIATLLSKKITGVRIEHRDMREYLPAK